MTLQISRTQLLAVLAPLALVAGGYSVGQRWPSVLNDFRGCHSDSDCAIAPGCHPTPIAAAKRDAWNAHLADCHCGPCRFAASAKTPADAWKAWASQVVKRKELCPEDPATASIVCEKPRPTVCSTVSQVCVTLEPDDSAPARKHK